MLPGDLIDGRFQIERQVARGGTSRVYRALDVQEGHIVALKIIECRHLDTAARFAREVSVLSRVTHPGIVRYIAHGLVDGGDRYLAMQWIDGVDLAERLRRPSALGAARDTLRMFSPSPSIEIPSNEDSILSLSETLRLGRRIALALGALHAAGWVHRDVKPGNILLPGKSIDDAVLVDLGTARTDVMEDVTLGGMVVGTPSYMSPEQASATDEISPASDLWSLGCVLYHALTGTAPFEGGPLLAVLARVLTEEPVPLATLRPDLPAEVSETVMRMLSKAPQLRPQNGAEANEALTALEALHGGRSVHDPVRRERAKRELARRERRARCVLVVRGDGGSADLLPRIIAIARDLVDEIHALADGTVLIGVQRDATAMDRARRAASAAFALRSALPRLRFALATERIEDALGEDVVTRAAHLVDAATPGGVHIDAVTAELLDLHFVVERNGRSFQLSGARSLDTARTLLGRPTACVGRRRELQQLVSLFEECVDEPMAHVALVIGDAGIGKSRLRAELLRALRASGREIDVFQAQGDSLGAGSPFAMLAAALRRAFGVLEHEPPADGCAKVRARVQRVMAAEDADRVAPLLGEIAGTPFPDDAHPALRAARGDPLMMNGAVLAAWVDWLSAECALGPVAIILDDLHWGDVPTMRFVDVALTRLADQPLFVLALARPEIKSVFPSLWYQHRVQELRLDGLSRKASSQLVRDILGDRASDALVARLVERSGGNAFFLEELIRSVAEGSNGEPPGTVLAVLHARLGALGDAARSVLCAASIFGESFTASGLHALVGDAVEAFGLSEWLESLLEREILTRHGASTDGDVFKFRHALIRDVAYDLLTLEDRVAGHLAAAMWLEQTNFAEPLAVAEQFVRGGQPIRAVRWFRRAAEQALEGRDLEAVHRHVERGLEAGADREDRTVLRRLQALAAYWQSNYASAANYATDATLASRPGSRDWFLAMAELVVSSARISDFATVEARFVEASSTAAEPGAQSAQLVCLCRSTFQMIFHGRFDASDAMLARIDALATDTSLLDPLTIAQIHHVRGVRAAHAGFVSTFLHHLELAIDAFEQAGDRNNVLLERTTVGWCWAELGQFEIAERKIRESLKACAAAGSRQAITYAKVNLGFALIHRPGSLDEAMMLLRESIAECRAVGNARLEGWATAHASTAAIVAGLATEGAELATSAVRLLESAPSLLGWAEACRSRAYLALGRVDDALEAASRAMKILVELRGMLQGEALPPLVLAEALRAANRPVEVRAAIADARARLDQRADRLARPEWREPFFAIPDHVRILALAAELES